MYVHPYHLLYTLPFGTKKLTIVSLCVQRVSRSADDQRIMYVSCINIFSQCDFFSFLNYSVNGKYLLIGADTRTMLPRSPQSICWTQFSL